MATVLSLSIMSICVFVIIWGLHIYKENRLLEKQHRKFLDEEDRIKLR